MFILDSLMIAGIRWALETTLTAAEAEMNDDTALREQLLEAEMRREMGEITDDEFAELEAELLGRIREIKQRREGGAGPLAFGGAQPMETSPDSSFQVEASVSGDFYDPADQPHTTVVETAPVQGALGNLVQTASGDSIEVLDIKPGDAHELSAPSLPLTPNRSNRSKRSDRSGRSNVRTKGTARTTRTRRTTRTARPKK